MTTATINMKLDADVEVGDILRQPYDLVAREENSGFFEIIFRYGKVLPEYCTEKRNIHFRPRQ